MMDGFTAYRLTFFVPIRHAEKVKKAIFQSGAGSEKGYAESCWEVLGVGQFVPQQTSTPYIGKVGERSLVPELRVETICPRKKVEAVIEALIESHPYEVPAYDLKPIYRLGELPD